MTTSQGRVAGILTLVWVGRDSAWGPDGWRKGGGSPLGLKKEGVWAGISSWGVGLLERSWARSGTWLVSSLQELTFDLSGLG
jgi:hypothetical protein